ncbi:MAG TPA: alanine racemase [Candidatus Sulfotelmatobacter sp.]|nr:alanine racemase [Candidatus Sulfotelmatobacter sp.]
MGPDIDLDGETLRANAAGFAALGAPVAAVVKADGYGWGARRLARELDDVVESYVVADADELAALRSATSKPIRLLADAARGALDRVLALGGIPNVSTREAVAEAAAAAAVRGPLTVRVGLLDAAGWAAIRPADAPAFAAALAGTGLRVELWTHLTSTARAAETLAGFAAGRRCFVEAGVPVIGVDLASTAWAGSVPAGDRLRIGVGLFGARLGAPVATRCALRVRAKRVRYHPPGSIGWAGYGDVAVSSDRSVSVLRCGYADGLPKTLAGSGTILSIGMQYTTRLDGEEADAELLIGGGDDVDALAARAGITSHELVVGLARE